MDLRTPSPWGDPPPEAPMNGAPLEPARARGPRTQPFDGCPLFSAEEVPEVPRDAPLGLRLGVACDGEDLWFNRKPLPVTLTEDDILRRWGPPAPGVYRIQLCDLNPETGRMRKFLKQKTLAEIPAEGEDDVGEEEWPLQWSDADMPRALRAERDRRREVRRTLLGTGPAVPGAWPPAQGLPLAPAPMGVQAPPSPPPAGYAWSHQPPAGWVLVQVQVGAPAKAERSIDEWIALGTGFVGVLTPLVTVVAKALGSRATEQKDLTDKLFSAVLAKPGAPTVSPELAEMKVRLEYALKDLAAAKSGKAGDDIDAMVGRIDTLMGAAERLGMGRAEKEGLLTGAADLLDTKGGERFADRLAGAIERWLDKPEPATATSTIPGVIVCDTCRRITSADDPTHAGHALYALARTQLATGAPPPAALAPPAPSDPPPHGVRPRRDDAPEEEP